MAVVGGAEDAAGADGGWGGEVESGGLVSQVGVCIDQEDDGAGRGPGGGDSSVEALGRSGEVCDVEVEGWVVVAEGASGGVGDVDGDGGLVGPVGNVGTVGVGGETCGGVPSDELGGERGAGRELSS